MAEVAEKGIVDRVFDGLTGFARGIDRGLEEIENPYARGAAKLAFDVAIIALGVIAFYYMTTMGGGTLSNPSLLKMMSMPMTLGATAYGIARLIRDFVPNKYHMTASKVAAAISPIAMLVATGLVVSVGWQLGYCSAAVTGYVLAAFVIVPLSLYSFNHMLKVWGRKKIYVVEGPVPEEVRQAGIKRTLARQAARNRAKRGES